MKVSVYSICPYCGTKNDTEIEYDYITTKKQVVTCDVLENGCDRDYVVEAKLNVDCVTRSLIHD